ncbi:phospholipid scramblase 1 [Tachyglossus aculeatus]|uniref:phospholipid scramblase 1 n=1 Tax=Tachyglossus aculeatus TaxID=9261 RepID=UPI0018F2D801|nr:phospholipid scramblase 1 [Tachyglossus aculeatus]XP_038599329.1 phospholipid scramblase 1 [Tachyglossus aculeatus]XP_038599336.1 phospholipid scramblase 1 [Tachyglossus aculeatus]XP_038599344.1 phospholipid scramblase 1 [Tachyglossus aculeatus]
MDVNYGHTSPDHLRKDFPPGYPPQNAPGGFQGPVGYPVPYGGYPAPAPGGIPAQMHPTGFAIQSQPGGPIGTPWMVPPPPPPNCPPGLEYLSQVDQVLIHQQIELLEVLIGFETNNKYEIKNSLGQRVYFAVEENDCCTRNCCGAARPFVLKILDNLGREVISLQRPLRCSSCWFPCCLQELEVQSPPGVTIGFVVQNWHLCLPKFTIQNEHRQDVLKITGPCVVCSCCSDVDFQVKGLDEQSVVGKISKQWSGLVREAFTDSDNFGIQFPLDLDVKMKAVMLGACFLIDFMYFENAGNQS